MDRKTLSESAIATELNRGCERTWYSGKVRRENVRDENRGPLRRHGAEHKPLLRGLAAPGRDPLRENDPKVEFDRSIAIEEGFRG